MDSVYSKSRKVQRIRSFHLISMSLGGLICMGADYESTAAWSHCVSLSIWLKTSKELGDLVSLSQCVALSHDCWQSEIIAIRIWGQPIFTPVQAEPGWLQHLSYFLVMDFSCCLYRKCSRLFCWSQWDNLIQSKGNQNWIAKSIKLIWLSCFLEVYIHKWEIIWDQEWVLPTFFWSPSYDTSIRRSMLNLSG